jgi:predicted CXXCH cytochrome family protein
MNPKMHRTWTMVLVLGCAGALMASMLPALAAIENSHHDFSNGSWAGGEICAPCHTPHDGDETVTSAPLWNHALTTATYTLYGSATLDATLAQPGSVSKLCLSCHDGTVATDSFGGSTGSRTISSWSLTGTVLTSHHPVSFTYDATLATTDGELANPSSTSSGLGSTITNDLLFSGRLECSSCHDVHVERNTQGCSGCHAAHGPSTNLQTLSLRKSNDNSALCLTCHVK